MYPWEGKNRTLINSSFGTPICPKLGRAQISQVGTRSSWDALDHHKKKFIKIKKNLYTRIDKKIKTIDS